MKRLLIAILLAALVAPAIGQNILGKHPADKVLDPFMHQNGNAETIVRGINLAATPVTNVANVNSNNFDAETRAMLGTGSGNGNPSGQKIMPAVLGAGTTSESHSAPGHETAVVLTNSYIEPDGLPTAVFLSALAVQVFPGPYIHQLFVSGDGNIGPSGVASDNISGSDIWGARIHGGTVVDSPLFRGDDFEAKVLNATNASVSVNLSAKQVVVSDKLYVNTVAGSPSFIGNPVFTGTLHFWGQGFDGTSGGGFNGQRMFFGDFTGGGSGLRDVPGTYHPVHYMFPTGTVPQNPAAHTFTNLQDAIDAFPFLDEGPIVVNQDLGILDFSHLTVGGSTPLYNGEYYLQTPPYITAPTGEVEPRFDGTDVWTNDNGLGAFITVNHPTVMNTAKTSFDVWGLGTAGSPDNFYRSFTDPYTFPDGSPWERKAGVAVVAPYVYMEEHTVPLDGYKTVRPRGGEIVFSEGLFNIKTVIISNVLPWRIHLKGAGKGATVLYLNDANTVMIKTRWLTGFGDLSPSAQVDFSAEGITFTAKNRIATFIRLPSVCPIPYLLDKCAMVPWEVITKYGSPLSANWQTLDGRPPGLVGIEYLPVNNSAFGSGNEFMGMAVPIRLLGGSIWIYKNNFDANGSYSLNGGATGTYGTMYTNGSPFHVGAGISMGEILEAQIMQNHFSLGQAAVMFEKTIGEHYQPLLFNNSYADGMQYGIVVKDQSSAIYVMQPRIAGVVFRNYGTVSPDYTIQPNNPANIFHFGMNNDNPSSPNYADGATTANVKMYFGVGGTNLFSVDQLGNVKAKGTITGSTTP